MIVAILVVWLLFWLLLLLLLLLCGSCHAHNCMVSIVVDAVVIISVFVLLWYCDCSCGFCCMVCFVIVVDNMIIVLLLLLLL